MTEKEYTKQAALEHGADLVGVVRVEDLPEHSERIERMLPEAQSVLVIATNHSLASLRSGANELAQFDTIHAYNDCARQQIKLFLHVFAQLRNRQELYIFLLEKEDHLDVLQMYLCFPL